MIRIRSHVLGKGWNFLYQRFALIMIIVSLILPAGEFHASAGQDKRPWYEVRTIYTADYGLEHPQGMTFSPTANTFLGWDRDGDVTGIAMNEDRIETAGLSIAVADTGYAAFDEYTEGLFVLNPENTQLQAYGVKQNGLPATDTGPVQSANLKALNIQTLGGMTFDPGDGRLFLLDPSNSQIITIAPGAGSGFDGTAASREGRVRRISLGMSRHATLKGIAFNPNTGTLYILDAANQQLYEINQNGQTVSSSDLSSLGLIDPQSLIFAPSADATDAPARMNLFILDSGVPVTTTDTSSPVIQADLASGRIIELALTALPAAPANQLPSSLVNIINTSNTAWYPSSPDTSGVAYWPQHNTLLMSDSEVEEMPPYWVGKNVFESSLSGSLINTCTTYPGFSAEPTGVGINPANNHIFFSDDDMNRISEVNPGPDNTYCTGDDTVTYVNVLQTYNIDDAEDVAYGQNTLFIAGGVDAEVYLIGLGANGVIGGGDDGPLAHFDTSALGFQDLEGIGYNPDRGTLFILSTQGSDNYLGEVTTGGVLINAYSLAYLSGPRSGLTYAPSSQNPSVKNIYIASRGVDNGADPNENDGKVWEISLGSLPYTPTATGTSTSTLTPPTGASTNPVYISLTNSGTVGGIAFADEDIVCFDGQSWSLFFDGSDVGLGATDTLGFSLVDADTILFAFSSTLTLGGVAVTPRDIVRFDAASLGNTTSGTFSMYLNGIDVGLDATAENIDAISTLSDGRILISTTGSSSVPGLKGADEDVLAFTPMTLGDMTSGTWTMYFDGSDVGLGDSSEDIDALDVMDGSLYLSTLANFSVSGVTGADDDIFVCSPTSLGAVTACNYSTSLYFDGSAWGMDAHNIDGVKVLVPGESTVTPTATLTATSTSSATPTSTATSTPTPTQTSIFSDTPTATDTFTPTEITSSSPTSTYTETPSPTLTNTPSATSTPSATLISGQPGGPLYLSLSSGGAVAGIGAEDVDILYFNGTNWSLFFDASDVGISTSGQDLNDFHIIDSSTLLITFESPITLGGLAVDPWDIVQFHATSLGNVTSGTFSMYLDGNDVGLDTTSEVIDALSVLPDGRVLISTVNNSSVPGLSGLDEDILAFTPISLGDVTSGTWAMYLDGSDVGLADSSSEDVSGLDVAPNGGIFLATLGNFSVSGLSGMNEDVFVCVPISLGDDTSCSYAPTLYFDGSLWALDSNAVDGVHIP